MKCTCGPRRRKYRELTIAGRGKEALLLRYVRRLKLHYGRPRFGEPKTQLVVVRRKPCPLHPKPRQLPLFEDCPLPRRRIPQLKPPTHDTYAEPTLRWDDDDDCPF